MTINQLIVAKSFQYVDNILSRIHLVVGLQLGLYCFYFSYRFNNEVIILFASINELKKSFNVKNFTYLKRVQISLNIKQLQLDTAIIVTKHLYSE